VIVSTMTVLVYFNFIRCETLAEAVCKTHRWVF